MFLVKLSHKANRFAIYMVQYDRLQHDIESPENVVALANRMNVFCKCIPVHIREVLNLIRVKVKSKSHWPYGSDPSALVQILNPRSE